MGATSEMYIQIQDGIMQQINDAKIGNINHIDAFINLRYQRDKLQQSLDLIKSYEQDNEDYIKSECQEYPDGHRGYIFELRNGRTTYNYSGIKDVVDAKESVKNLENKYKIAFLQKQKGLTIIDEETGEVINDFPTVKYSKGSVILKPKK